MKNIKKRTVDCLFVFLIIVGIGGYLFYIDFNRRSIKLTDKNIDITINTEEWTNEDIKLSVNYKGNIDDIKEYSFDNCKTWSKDNFSMIESNQIVNVCVKDINDRLYKKDIDIKNIDKDGPIILMNDNIKVSRNSQVDLNNYVTVYDNGVGIRDGIVYTPISLNTTVLGEQKIYVYTIDKLANKTIKQITFEVVPQADFVLAKDIILNHKILIMKNDTEDTLSANIVPKYTTNKNIKWESDNPNIVSVDIYGNIKALSPGEAVVTATTANGISSSCTIFVK